jgi:competence protein ComEC
MYSAASIWASLFLPAPFRVASLVAFALLSLVLFRGRSFIAIGLLVITALISAANIHPQLVSLTQEFNYREVSFEAIQDGTKLTQVKLLKVSGCDSCSGAYGQYLGSLNTGDVASGNLLIRPSFGFGEFVLRGRPARVKPSHVPLLGLRQSFLSNARGVTPESTALVRGLAIGDTQAFTLDFATRLKQLSLTHLAAVSGANCAIVVGAVFWGLGFFIRRRSARTALALLALAGYVELVGPQPSVLRAALMSALVLLALARGIWPLAALSWALILLLWWQPNYATDYGFALSVCATGAILILAPRISEWLSERMPGWLALSLAVTFAAQLWCMPILLSLQGGVPTYAVLANLMAEPVVAPITILGIIAAALSGIFPALTQFLTFVASVPAQWIVAITHKLSGLPAVTLGWHTGLVGMLLLVTGVTGLFTSRKKLGAAITSMVLLVEVSCGVYGAVHSATWLPENWRILNCDVGQGDGLVIRSQGEIAVVDVGRNDQPIHDCLDSLGIHEINLLVLTHYDADHIGGLAGALQGRKVDRVFLTPFHDTRPIVARTAMLLRGISDVERVGIGTSGTLGDYHWEVLSPSATAEEAEDSNDGSIVMRWECPDWVLYTMADLGERGQMRMVERFGSYLNHPANKWLILKVSHHGSADQYAELIEAMHPDIALISVGLGNSYGHPTQRTLNVLKLTGAIVLRTDLEGELAVYGNLRYAVAHGG